ncbi:helix-turn-helix domain-containing protein [Amycolatopsis sp.]|uniref:TetR/AcrR family transcriptional regulator n=1 Tax=Amycolatopsis sp. TaxID=37632 RepID=UPI002CEEC08B|nr:helix-turn-helix domain-containing protein [Amycolatopsis sp.]HVV09971.1 helix-turn-helix domain-containing protein [Amycolatopsis sp.]
MGTPSASKPMRADARRNYERILAVAREVFAEQGPDAPMDDIARRAGVGAGTLYRHFPCRETLIEAVYREDIERLCSLARELRETHEPFEALSQWMRAQVEFALMKRGLASTLKAAMDKDSETFALCRNILNEAAASVVKPAQEAGLIRADVEARDVLRMGHGLAVASDGVPEATDRMLSVLLDGLRVTA